MMWVNLGPAYDMVPTSGTGTGGTINPGSGVTLKRHIYSAAIRPPPPPCRRSATGWSSCIPSPYSTGMPETVIDGRRDHPEAGSRASLPSASCHGHDLDHVHRALDLSNTALPAGITGDKSVYIVREVAYVANTITIPAATPSSVSCSIIRPPTT